MENPGRTGTRHFTGNFRRRYFEERLHVYLNFFDLEGSAYAAKPSIVFMLADPSGA